MSKKNRGGRMDQQTVTKKDVAVIPAAALTGNGEPTKPAKEPERFMLGKKYVPKTERNTETWGKITKLLNAGPKTLAEISEEIKGHTDFLGYMRRGGHVVPFVPEQAPAK